MSNYECDKCNKKFKSYNGCYRHKKRNTCSDVKFKCNHCNNPFKHKKNLTRHINNTCIVIKEQKKQKDQLTLMQKQMEEKDKEIELLKQSKQVQNINVEGDNINIHLHINPHGQENIDNINIAKIVNIFISYINRKFHNLIIPAMVKEININTDENKNVYIPNLRANYALVLENNKWNHKEMNLLLNDIMVDNMGRTMDLINNNKELFIQQINIATYYDFKYNINNYFDNSLDKEECKKKIKDIIIANRSLISAFYEGISSKKIKMST
jgi:hypothetical protein